MLGDALQGPGMYRDDFRRLRLIEEENSTLRNQIELLERRLATSEAARTGLVGVIHRQKEALEKIERWVGEFPDTGRTWPADQGGGPVSYGAQYGSNGERDYMRGVARAALKARETK